MACLNRIFSVKELEALDEKQLAILHDAIRREAMTSTEVGKVLRTKVEPLYKRWVAAGRAQRGRGAKAAKRRGK